MCGMGEFSFLLNRPAIFHPLGLSLPFPVTYTSTAIFPLGPELQSLTVFCLSGTHARELSGQVYTAALPLVFVMAAWPTALGWLL